VKWTLSGGVRLADRSGLRSNPSIVTSTWKTAKMHREALRALTPENDGVDGSKIYSYAERFKLQ
jgi:hypothetical protein